ncbi:MULTISPECIES: toprim domain-containing protein [Bacillus]|uniref:toprim domain-containing protein n=1 Tax=Bacillus TaxID=1386 RepID=UPI000B3E5964|nr:MULTISPECIES: toprim domain-containing protein [Bacillus]ARW41730.1 hypothetical protein S100141_00407 [Bacillus licheniformis]MCA1182491.1 toprim domain-containing protein [Bacillus licheniformis]MEC0475001.1 toprim domain-containing protein [Bacillus licheniformis]MEC3606327.1 toprim domain-containing protein [Bacillus glycinifermentans]PRS16408.1 hypothetical protein C6W27_08355 [Bacillus paralicheniformis]
MVTQDEIKKLNQQVQIPLLLTFLGGPVPKQLGNRPDWRCHAWWRGGDNPHGVGITYNYEMSKYYVTDFTGKTCTNYDLLDFMTKILGLSFRDALDQLIFASGKDNGYEGDNTIPDLSNPPQRKLERPEPIDVGVFETFEKGLHPYWRDRGYTPEIAERYKLGWCTYGEMKDRLTIPIVDERGYLVSIQGRTLNDRIEPKYKFLEGTGESAKLTLYNFIRAFNNAQERGWVGVTEGANAVWRADQYGYQNFVGTLSTSVTERQIDLLMYMKVNVVILYDFDASETMAGQVASISLANKLLLRGHRGVYIANIGFHADPEDLTLEQWTMTLKNAIHYK